MADLKTDYVNDVLDTDVNNERTYNLVDANGNLIYEGIKIRETTVLSTTGDNYGALQINEQNTKINQINNDLSETIKASQIGSGTTTETIDISQKSSISIVCKKSNIIAKSIKIPTSILASGDKIPIGLLLPVATQSGLDIGYNATPLVWRNYQGIARDYAHTFYVGISADGSTTMYSQIDGSSARPAGTMGSITPINLGANSANAQGGTITYNGDNSFTITVTDSTLSVYILA